MRFSFSQVFSALSTNFTLSIPEIDKPLRERMPFWDRRKERFLTWITLRFFTTRLSNWGARRLGRLHGKYNWPPGDMNYIDPFAMAIIDLQLRHKERIESDLLKKLRRLK
jgi:hypothetical protein